MRTSSRARKRERAETAQTRSRGSLSFIRQVLNELKKVVTPTRRELFSYTGVVLVFVIFMMGVVYGLDYGFSCTRRTGCSATARSTGDSTMTNGRDETVTEQERRDMDLATAAEQSSEEDEAQEGNVLDAEEHRRRLGRAQRHPHRRRRSPTIEADLEAPRRARRRDRPRGRRVVDDALDIDSRRGGGGRRSRRPRRRSSVERGRSRPARSTRTTSSAPNCAPSSASGTSSTPTPASRSA